MRFLFLGIFGSIPEANFFGAPDGVLFSGIPFLKDEAGQSSNAIMTLKARKFGGKKSIKNRT